MKFTDLSLNENIIQALQMLNFDTPTEIQKQVIPIILTKKDLIASAETGGGKTLAYLIPILQLLLDTPPNSQMRGPRVLVLVPTRELAEQVNETVKNMTKFTNLRAGVITGGVPYFSQENLLRKPLDILIATPGRLIDHMNRNRVDFSRLGILVLDEADRMLDMGFIHDIEEIIKPMPAERQMLLFSATFEGQIQKITSRFLKHPARVKINHETKPPVLISQCLHQADNYNHKRALLNHILSEDGVFQAIVFTATKAGAETLAYELNANEIECEALHGDMKQSKRTRTLDRMRAGRIKVLVATDVAARGIDIKSINLVVNFDFPKSVDDYIHRVGRTGRCGESGTAISLIGANDWSQVAILERITKQRLERKVIAGLEPKLQEQSRTQRSKPKFGRSQSGSAKTFKPHGRRNQSQRERNFQSQGQSQRQNHGQSQHSRQEERQDSSQNQRQNPGHNQRQNQRRNQNSKSNTNNRTEQYNKSGQYNFASGKFTKNSQNTQNSNNPRRNAKIKTERDRTGQKKVIATKSEQRGNKEGKSKPYAHHSREAFY